MGGGCANAIALDSVTGDARRFFGFDGELVKCSRGSVPCTAIGTGMDETWEGNVVAEVVEMEDFCRLCDCGELLSDQYKLYFGLPSRCCWRDYVSKMGDVSPTYDMIGHA